jgi:predicted heme/steroid binding protein/uncharacterized membrane protein
MKEIDPKELLKSNGEKGKPIYIAHQGKVFDVTKSKLWQGGVHMNRHRAGHDLTTDIQAAPHGPEVLDRYPQVAGLKKQAAAGPEMPAIFARLLTRFPMLRRHPHPMTVHFPIVFTFAATMFTLLFLVTGIRAFELTAVHCLGAALLFTPVAMATGYYTWWLNYLSKPLRPVTIKQRVAVVLLICEIIAFVWRIATVDILSPLRLASCGYLILILALFPLAAVLGWFGASMTFPVEKEGS